MQLRTEGERNVETSGVVETRAFSIKANGKAFRILLDGLYSDKVLAIVRELCTNAFDAHLDAKNEAPFFVHVPSRWTPNFYVRDYGCSMTHDQVMGLYTTVFDSTKDARNDAVGAFGLGSKSPFAYSDTFQVTVWLDGEQRVYNAVIGGDGTPEISLFMRGPSTEPNGVMVGFPVRLEDVNAFKTAIKRVYCGFAVPFELLNVDQDANEIKELQSFKPARCGQDWFLFDKRFGEVSGLQGLLARQGCVVYPVETSKIAATAAARGQRETLKLFESDWRNEPHTAILDFDIGELSVAANRESLAYDNDTVTAIVDRLELFARDLVKDAEKILVAKATQIEMVQAFDELQVGHQIKALIGRTVKFKGEPVQDIVYRFTHGVRKDGNALGRDFGLAMTGVREGASRPSFRAALTTTIELRRNPVFVADPGTVHRATNRVAAALASASKRPVFWIRPTSTAMTEADFYAAVRRLLDGMAEGLDYTKIEDLVPLNLSKGSIDRRDYTPFRIVDLFERTVAETYDHEAEDGGLYVLMRQNQFVWKGSDGSMQLLSISAISEIVSVVDATCGTALGKRTLIGIIGNSHSIPEKHEGWTSLQDAVKDALKTGFDHQRLANTLRKEAVRNMEGVYGSPEHNLITHAGWLASNVSNNAELAGIAEQKFSFEGMVTYSRSQLRTLQTYVGLVIPEAPKEEDAPYVGLAKRLAMKYPLLGSVDFRRTTSIAVEQYINMVDASSAPSTGDQA